MVMVAKQVLWGIWLFYLLVGIMEVLPFVRQRAREVAQRLREEMFPFIIPLAVAHYLVRVWLERGDNPWFNGGAVMQLAVWLMIWWTDYRRGGGGGRWKRRLHRWANRVRVRGSRLAVQPGGN